MNPTSDDYFNSNLPQVEKYFVSGGFAFVHPDSSADVCAVEAVKVADLDVDAVRAGLQVRAALLRCCACLLRQHSALVAGCLPRLALGSARDAATAGAAFFRMPLKIHLRNKPRNPPPPSTSAPSPAQEYTNKLAAVQGKGDEYETAAAQVRDCWALLLQLAAAAGWAVAWPGLAWAVAGQPLQAGRLAGVSWHVWGPTLHPSHHPPQLAGGRGGLLCNERRHRPVRQQPCEPAQARAGSWPTLCNNRRTPAAPVFRAGLVGRGAGGSSGN